MIETENNQMEAGIVKAYGKVIEPCVFFAFKRRNMSNNIQATITGQIPPCLQQKIDKHGKQGKSRKSDEK